jgi:calpain-15
MEDKVKNENDSNTKRQEIAPGVFFEKRYEKISGKLFANIEIDNTVFRLVDIKVDLSKSSRIQTVNGGQMLVHQMIEPFSKVLLARLILEKNYNLKTSVKFDILAPSFEMQKRYMKTVVTIIEEEIKSTIILKGIDLNNISEIDLFEFLNSNSLKFVDHDFLPNSNSVFASEEDTFKAFGYIVHWRRLEEIIKTNNEVKYTEDVLVPIKEMKIDPSDVNQGELGNSWLMSVFTALAEYPILIKRLFLTSRPNKYGVFKIKLCKMSRWRTFLVDDFFPCMPLGEPFFAKNIKLGYWVLVLEKAYAKLYGNYSQLAKGNPLNALIDTTACPTFSYDLTASNIRDSISDGSFRQQIKNWKNKNYIIVASLKDQPQLQLQKSKPSDFSFSIIKTYQDDEDLFLLCIRDPWGIVKWKGDWSEESSLWTTKMIQKIKPTFIERDGNFWISWKDFLTLFTKITVCYSQQWEELIMKGKFVTSISTEDPNIKNCCSRWHYELHVPEKSKVLIGVHQEDAGFLGADEIRPYTDLGVAILQKVNNTYKFVMQSNTGFERQCYLETTLEQGVYYIVPRSLGINLDHFKNSEKYIGSFEIDDQLVISVIKDVFEKYDISCNNILSYSELTAFFRFLDKNLEISEYDVIINEFGRRNKHTGELEGLSEMGFVHLFFSLLENLTISGKVDLFKRLGYDERLFSYRTRSFIFSIHSDIHLKIVVKDALEENIDMIVSKLLIRKFGKNTKTDVKCITSDEKVCGFYYFEPFTNKEFTELQLRSLQ